MPSSISFQGSHNSVHPLETIPSTDEIKNYEPNDSKSSSTNSTLKRNNEIVGDSLRSNRSSSSIIMNAAALNAYSVNVKETSNHIKELTGSGNLLVIDNDKSNSHPKLSNSLSNPINTKTSQIVEAVSTASSSTSEALTNFMSSTESTKHSYTYNSNNGSVFLIDESLNSKQLNPKTSNKDDQLAKSVQATQQTSSSKKADKEKNKKPWYSVSKI